MCRKNRDNDLPVGVGASPLHTVTPVVLSYMQLWHSVMQLSHVARQLKAHDLLELGLSLLGVSDTNRSLSFKMSFHRTADHRLILHFHLQAVGASFLSNVAISSP